MKTLRSGLRTARREFGSHLLHVPALLKWTADNGLLLITVPDVVGYDLVEVEGLLCAIERGAQLSEAEATAIVAKDPLPDHREDADSPAWLVGAETHSQWRQTIRKAIDDGSLRLLDGRSRLPLNAAPKAAQDAEQGAMTPAERRAAYDITTERGARRLILEHWDAIEKQWGANIDAHNVLRVLKREMDSCDRLPVLKTVQNLLIDLRRENLIP